MNNNIYELAKIVYGKKRIRNYNSRDCLNKCYGKKQILDNLISFEDGTTILFLFEGGNQEWTLNDHEIAVTVCLTLNRDFINELFINNEECPLRKYYKKVYEFLRKQNLFLNID